MKLISIIRKTDTDRSNFIYNLETLKHFPSSVREWNNSIYSYNKNTLPLIPNISKLTISFIKNYFYLYNQKIERKLRKKTLYNKFRKLSTSKIFINKGEFKHTNNKVLITLYIYNKQKKNYILKLKKRYLRKFFKNILSLKRKNVFSLVNSQENKFSSKLILLKKMKKINIRGFKMLELINWYKLRFLKLLRILYKEKKINKYISVSKYVNGFYKKLIKKSLKRLLIYMYYKQLIYINKSKFNYTYLQNLSKCLKDIFNKNIEFNFVNLNYFYLNSDMLSESILLKITKNRRRISKHLRNLKDKVRIKKKSFLYNKSINKKLNLKQYFNDKNLFESYIINNLKYRHITGFRLEAKGRLNKRYTASRSMYKLKYKGNLLNINSSYNGLSSVLLKGNLNSNIQYTKLNSKTRIGSFGIKGWVSGN